MLSTRIYDELEELGTPSMWETGEKKLQNLEVYFYSEIPSSME